MAEMRPKVRLVHIDKRKWRENRYINYQSGLDGYVSESLKPEMLEWLPGMCIFITAGTGAGKNTFIESVLLPYISQRGEKAMYFSNRSVLSNQVIRRMADVFGVGFKLDYYTDMGISHEMKTLSPCFTVSSYQCLGKRLKEGNVEKELEKAGFDWIICDEAHYFLSDSYFNALTDMELEFIRNRFKNAIKVFMSATPDEILPSLLPLREDLISDSRPNVLRQTFFQEFRKRWVVYDFLRDFSKIEPWFGTEEECIETVRQSKGKSVIFVESVKHGKELKNILGGEAELVTAQSKQEKSEGYDTMTEIVKKEKFSCRFLITTAVLDNGVNLKDSQINNIVIFVNDKCRFIQSLGRVRKNGQEGVLNVYIPIIDRKKISDLKMGMERRIKAYQNYEAAPSDFYIRYIANKNPIVDVSGSFIFTKKDSYHFNELGKDKAVYYDLPFYEKLLNEYSEENPFPFEKEKFLWMQKEFSLERQIGGETRQKAIGEFDHLMELFDGKSLDKESQNEFRAKFTDLYQKAFGKQKNDKNSTVYGLKIINGLLKKRGGRYIVESGKEGWVIKKL